MRRLDYAEARHALARLELLEDDHRAVAPLHATVETLGIRYLETGFLASIKVEEFRSAIAGLITIYGQHILVEDNVVFPIAAKLLSVADRNAVGKEMADRRNVRPIQIELREKPA